MCRSSEEWCQGSRNFCNKLWNATRFALMNGATVEGELPAHDELSTVDKWILSRLQHVIGEVDQHFEAFEFAKVCDGCTTSPGTTSATGTWSWPSRC